MTNQINCRTVELVQRQETLYTTSNGERERRRRNFKEEGGWCCSNYRPPVTRGPRGTIIIVYKMARLGEVLPFKGSSGAPVLGISRGHGEESVVCTSTNGQVAVYDVSTYVVLCIYI